MKPHNDKDNLIRTYRLFLFTPVKVTEHALMISESFNVLPDAFQRRQVSSGHQVIPNQAKLGITTASSVGSRTVSGCLKIVIERQLLTQLIQLLID